MRKVQFGTLADQGVEEARYWLKKSVTERVAAALELHRFWLESR